MVATPSIQITSRSPQMLSASATRFFCAFAAIAAWRKLTSISRLQYGQPSWPKYSITRLPCFAASATSSRSSSSDSLNQAGGSCAIDRS